MKSPFKLSDFNNYFFIGIAGTGMSAIAQYLAGSGFKISGSDRYFLSDESKETQKKLKNEGIKCHPQDGSGIDAKRQCIVISTAIESSNPELQKSKQYSIPVITRSQLLSMICDTKKTIAVGGTSGKSTTSAMLFDILQFAGLDASIISGAGLTRIIKQGKIGNAFIGKGEWLVIEADESDGSIVNYNPTVGLLLNIDKDHKELDELDDLFLQFKNNTKDLFVINASHKLTRKFSQNTKHDFSSDENEAGFKSKNFNQKGFEITFEINDVNFHMNTIGKHNMENALAATCVANQIGVSLETCAKALENYEGIFRRNQIVGNKRDITLIDDYAHNPAKVSAALSSCQNLSKKVIAWFQPHGYGPTKFLRKDFVEEISKTLREDDEIWMSEIYYAGGTAVKDISSHDLIEDIKANHKKAFFVSNRDECIDKMLENSQAGDLILLMGARDPSLDTFAVKVLEKL